MIAIDQLQYHHFCHEYTDNWGDIENILSSFLILSNQDSNPFDYDHVDDIFNSNNEN